MAQYYHFVRIYVLYGILFSRIPGPLASMYVYVSPNVTAVAGKTATLKCVYQTNATTFHTLAITWSKDNTRVLENRSGTVTDYGNFKGRVSFLPGKGEASLKISPVNFEDSGKYKCLVSVSDPNGGDKDGSVNLAVHSPLADMHVFVSSSVTAVTGKTAILKCVYLTNATTSYTVSITWSKDNMRVLENRSGNLTEYGNFKGRVSLLPGIGEASLKIQHVKFEDSGKYKCLVSVSDSNYVGDKDGSVNLAVYNATEVSGHKDEHSVVVMGFSGILIMLLLLLILVECLWMRRSDYELVEEEKWGACRSFCQTCFHCCMIFTIWILGLFIGIGFLVFATQQHKASKCEGEACETAPWPIWALIGIILCAVLLVLVLVKFFTAVYLLKTRKKFSSVKENGAVKVFLK